MDGLLAITPKPNHHDPKSIDTCSAYDFTIDGKDVGRAISKVVLTFEPDAVVTAQVTIAVGEVYAGLDGRRVVVKPDDVQIERLKEQLALIGYEIVKKAD